MNRSLLPILLTAVVFWNAALMFLLEPMVGKLLLPLLGGSPLVWNTCMVFFQTLLLAGYAAAHGVSTWLRPTWQLVLYALLQPLALLVLPPHVPETLMATQWMERAPALWLLGVLVVAIGAPFFVVAVTGPMLQKWFADSNYSSSRDPYYLYSASNVGSLLALLSYPLFTWLYPSLGLTRQARFWAVGYGVLVGAVIPLLLCLMAHKRRQPAALGKYPPADADRAPPPTFGRRLRWVAWAFLPSSLMLGVTTYFSTDITPMPLLWVIPLALYLLTFALVFARRKLVPMRVVRRALPLLALPLTLLLAAPDVQPPLPVSLLFHLGGFFVAALFCHGLLAEDRPSPAYLTDFYLWLAVGGVLGGTFNTLLAPLVFKTALEYPLILALICLVRIDDPQLKANRRLGWRDVLPPLGIAGLTAALILGLSGQTDWPVQLRVGILLGPPVLACYFLVDRPWGFAFGLTAVLLASRLYVGEQGRPLYTTRTYFGVLHVTADRAGRFHQLVHGRTIHGRQSLDPKRRRMPLSYYDPHGPVGRIMEIAQPRYPAMRVGVIGLGAGDLAGYARPGEDWTFYEIDPAVAEIATNPAFFTFLSDCPASYRIHIGDGRLRLQEAPDAAYDVFFLDAFSSDAIPTHLLTREAIQGYLRTLSDDGLLVLHVSNRYLDLKPVVANLAADAGLVARYKRTYLLSPEEIEEGMDPAEWIVLTRRETALGVLAKSPSWDRLTPQPSQPTWTDDSSNILDTLTRRVLEWE